MEIWSKRVLQLRMKLGLSQEQLATRLGATRVSVSNWETGEHAPTPVFQNILANLERQAQNGEVATP